MVEHNLAKVGVASSNLVSRSMKKPPVVGGFFYWDQPKDTLFLPGSSDLTLKSGSV